MKLYHNPRCSKSRATLALLEEKGQSPEIVEYLKSPPSESELSHICQLLGFESVRQLMRTKETIYEDLGLAEVNDEAELLKAMIENPKLIERPVLVCGERAALGRPPENVLDLI